MRMIDGDAILNSYCDDCPNREYCEDRESKCSCYSDIEEVIVNAKEIDYEPKKHGRWEINCDGYYPYCSNCKNEPQGREMTLYCPNCGARMDGDGE